MNFSPDGGPSFRFKTEGEEVRLRCDGVVYPNCSSTTWIFESERTSDSAALVTHGVIKKDPGRVERLSLGSDCSLNVRRVNTEDAGRYTCQQYLTEGGSQHGEDASIYLIVETSKYVSF